jgi:hypothetical protein
VKSELWAYLMTDDNGEEGVAYVETAGGTKVPMIAMTEIGAQALRPLAERMATILNRPWTLMHYSKGVEQETIYP